MSVQDRTSPLKGRQDDWFIARQPSTELQDAAKSQKLTHGTMKLMELLQGKKKFERVSSLTRTASGQSYSGQIVDYERKLNEESENSERHIAYKVNQEIEAFQKEQDDLHEEIFKMHVHLLRLGDPTEIPFPRVQLIKDLWIVEGQDRVAEPGIEFECEAQHGVHVLNCGGSEALTSISVKGSVKRLQIENCKRIRLVVEAVLFSISVSQCQDVVLVVGGEMPNVEVDSCTAVAFLVCHKMVDGKIRCVNSGGIMISTVDRGEHA